MFALITVYNFPCRCSLLNVSHSLVVNCMNIVTDRVVVGKIFNLEIFIVNRSRHIRRYTLVVPNRKRAKGSDPSQGSKVLPPLPSGERATVQNVPIDPYMEEPELLRRHVDNETTEADIICLENNVRLRYAS